MGQKIKTVFISRTSSLGGAERTLLNSIVKIDKNTFEPIAILPDKNGQLYDELKKNNVNILIVKMPFIRLTYNVFLYVWFFIKLLATNISLCFLFKREKINLVVNNSFQDSLYAIFAAKSLKIKQIIYIKNIFDRKWKKYIRAKILEFFAAKVIAVSEKAKEDILLYIRKENFVEVIYEGLDLLKQKGNYTEDFLNKTFQGGLNNCFKILNIGNLSVLKGQLLLVQAILTDKLKEKKIKVIFLGDAVYKKDLAYKENLDNLIKLNNSTDKFFFCGYQPDPEKYIINADLIIHCPTIDDCLPMVILESLIHGKIVLATNVGGIPEIIREGFNGFLCEPNKEDLADKILFIYKNIKNLDFIKSNAENTIIERFNLDIQIKKTEEVYKNILSK
jgi:glycosyltransferase involved in cell wall biosynthesis